MKMDIKLWGTAALGAVILTGACYLDHKRFDTPPITTQVGTTKVIEVPKITEKVVTQFVTDPAQAKLVTDLITENKRLKLEVVSLTSSISKNESKGGVGVNGGIITMLPQTTLTNTITKETEPAEFKFSDFQLEAKYSSKPSFTYNLSQEFIITTTTGKNKEGKQVQLVTLAQKVGDTMVAVPTTTVNIQSKPNPAGFHAGLRLQGGLGANLDGKSAIGVLQWLRWGTSSATEDSKFAFLSPAIGSGGLTLLPISYNLGSIRHSPATNLWVSPSIDLNKSIGAVVSVTF